MDRRAALAVLLALTVLLAGCQFGGSGTEGPPDDATESPDMTPTTSPFGDVSPPSGVDGSGVTDPAALLAAHGTALEGTSTTVAISFHLSVNGTDRNVSMRGKTLPGSDRGWMRVEFQDGHGTYYTADGTTYYKEIVNERARYGTTSDVSAVPERPRFGADQRIRTAVQSAEWEPVGTVERDGRTLLEFRASSVDPPDVNTTGESTISSSGRLLVDTDGVVHHVAVSTRVEDGSGTVDYGLSVTLTDVGSTTVEEPEWVGLAA